MAIEHIQMKEVKLYLYVLAIILFVSNYHICNYYYYVDCALDRTGWWGLKSQIYAVIIATIFFASSIKTKGILLFFLSIGVGLSASNFIDKAFYDVLVFTKEDVVMIILTVCFAALRTLKEIKDENSNRQRITFARSTKA